MFCYPGLRIVQVGGNNDSSVYLDLRWEVEQMTLPYSLRQSCKGTAGFGQMVVNILHYHHSIILSSHSCHPNSNTASPVTPPLYQSCLHWPIQNQVGKPNDTTNPQSCLHVAGPSPTPAEQTYWHHHSTTLPSHSCCHPKSSRTSPVIQLQFCLHWPIVFTQLSPQIQQNKQRDTTILHSCLYTAVIPIPEEQAVTSPFYNLVFTQLSSQFFQNKPSVTTTIWSILAHSKSNRASPVTPPFYNLVFTQLSYQFQQNKPSDAIKILSSHSCHPNFNRKS